MFFTQYSVTGVSHTAVESGGESCYHGSQIDHNQELSTATDALHEAETLEALPDKGSHLIDGNYHIYDTYLCCYSSKGTIAEQADQSKQKDELALACGEGIHLV